MTSPARQFSTAERMIRGIGEYALATAVPGTPTAAKRDAGAQPSIPCPSEFLNADEISATYFQGKVSAKWIRMNAPNKRPFGHSIVLWAKEDVCRWIETVGQKP